MGNTTCENFLCRTSFAANYEVIVTSLFTCFLPWDKITVAYVITVVKNIAVKLSIVADFRFDVYQVFIMHPRHLGRHIGIDS